MTVEAQVLLQQALELPPAERADFVDQLCLSLGSSPDEELMADWVREVERRIDLVDAGALALEPATEVFARLKAR